MKERIAGEQVGRFVLQQALGEGGMGTVYEALDTMLHRHVALKFLRPGKTDPELLLRGSIRESRVLAELNHQNIVHLYDVGVHEGCPYFVMELVRGKSLRVLCNAFGTLETFDALGISVQIGEGLCAAHGAGIIHNDLKPENVMMTANPAGHVKLVDFGLSRTVERASTGTTGELIDGKGTPHYMAPELHLGERATPPSDVYAWGQITHEMLTGRFLFERRTGDVPTRREVGRLHIAEPPISIVEIRGESLAEVERILFRMLSKRPEERPTSREALGLLQRELARLEVELPELSDRTLTAEVSRPPVVQVVSPAPVEETGPRTEPRGTVRGRIATLRMSPPVRDDAAPPTPVSPVQPSSPAPVGGPPVALGPSPRGPVSSASPVSLSVASAVSSSQAPVSSSQPRVSENLRRVLTTQIGSATRTSVAVAEGASIDAERSQTGLRPTGAPWMVRDLDTGEYRRLSYGSTEPLEAARQTRSSDQGGWTTSPVMTPERPTPPPGATPPAKTPTTTTSPVAKIGSTHRTLTERMPSRPLHAEDGRSRLWLGAIVGLTSAAAAFLVYLLAPSTGGSAAATTASEPAEPATTIAPSMEPVPTPVNEDAGAGDAGDAGANDAGATDAGTTNAMDDAGIAPGTATRPAAPSQPSMPAKAPKAAPTEIPRWMGDKLDDDDLFRPKDPKSAPTGKKPPPTKSATPAPAPAPTKTSILPFGKYGE